MIPETPPFCCYEPHNKPRVCTMRATHRTEEVDKAEPVRIYNWSKYDIPGETFARLQIYAYPILQ